MKKKVLKMYIIWEFTIATKSKPWHGFNDHYLKGIYSSSEAYNKDKD